ncbi:MAG: RluA family pseudouridine synthase [Archangium sp.]|nr:RluA family pseudouridine synthase [Archangium sp.]
MKHSLKVDTTSAGKRIDLVVGEALGLSRARVKALFEDGAVRINNKKAKKGLMVAVGDALEVDVPEAQASAAAMADTKLELRVLHEDDALVFVDKAAGVPTQPLQPGEQGTIANALVARYPEMSVVGDDPREAGLCHRLDVETSGVLLAARTRAAWEKMRAAFSEDRAVEKKYLALVKGPLADEGTIDVPLAHAGDHVVPGVSDGRPAITEFSVRARRGSYALVDVKLITGVLHQVRAHLAAVGAPIVGDPLYGGVEEPGLNRFFLHAVSLGVRHPTTGEFLRVESPLPPELAKVLDKHLPSAG